MTLGLNNCNANDLLTVVVRSSRERTKPLCIKLIEKQIVRDNIFIVEDISPFSKALLNSIEVALKNHKKYTVFIDADILLRSGTLKALITKFESLTEDVFTISSYTYDKFHGSKKSGGVHIYRTAYFEEAIKFKNEIFNSFRPETTMKIRLEELGFKRIDYKFITSYHDFGQYYHDIFRKMAFRVVKQPEIKNRYLSRFKILKFIDSDFSAAMKGFDFAETNNIIPRCDKQLFDQIINNAEIKFAEKDHSSWKIYFDYKTGFLFNRLVDRLYFKSRNLLKRVQT